MKTKTCTHCGVTYPAITEHYNRVGKLIPRLRAKCKHCEKAYREANKEHKREIDRIYRTNNRDKIAAKKSEYYQAHKEQENARYYEWKEANIEHLQEYQHKYAKNRKADKREYDREYRNKNRKRIMARQKRWEKENIKHVRMTKRAATARRAARKRAADGSYTPKDVKKQYKAQSGKCYYCGVKVGKKYHVDHVIPLSRGGSSHADNIVIACPHCNVTKNDRLPHEWPESNKLL